MILSSSPNAALEIRNQKRAKSMIFFILEVGSFLAEPSWHSVILPYANIPRYTEVQSSTQL